MWELRWKLWAINAKPDYSFNSKELIIQFKQECRVDNKMFFIVMQNKRKLSECHFVTFTDIFKTKNEK